MQGSPDIIVIGAGHAGAEAAWSAANALGPQGRVTLVTLRLDTIGVMSCNPAIGGLAKGQIVREIDALGGLMGLAADRTGINFKMLNTSKGAAVRGPRCQSDKHAYASTVRAMLEARDEIEIIEAAVERMLVQGTGSDQRITGVQVRTDDGSLVALESDAVILTTGTFMRGLMHQGQVQTPGGRAGEAPTSPISENLQALGFELGRLRTGTPPRLKQSTIDWESLQIQASDEDPAPFSELSREGWSIGSLVSDRFPYLDQLDCRQTRTDESAHEHIRANLDRAPMYSGDMSPGPRYCPSIEDKVVRFADRTSHGVFLEPEAHGSEWVYCNGIATSLPADIQDIVVKHMPGCENAEILQYGYAVEYDMVRPHQILATCETKSISGLYLAGQINGTSGYEEAAAQGLVAALNAVAQVRGDDPFVLGRDQAYIGVLMDDLVTKTPLEPYRMFTSRAEYRLMLRADNAPDRLTPIAIERGLLDTTQLGEQRRSAFAHRTRALALGRSLMNDTFDGPKRVVDRVLEADYSRASVKNAIGASMREALGDIDDAIYDTLHADRRYEPYIERQRVEIKRSVDLERRRIPEHIDYEALEGLRTESRRALSKFRPQTFGQASRLEGVTPADMTLLSVLIKRVNAEHQDETHGATR